MFGNCCGRKKKAKLSTRDKETQSDIELLTPSTLVLEEPSPNCDSDEVKLVGCVADQPKTVAGENREPPAKRVSIASHVRVEPSEDDDGDDEVFCDGVGPGVKLAPNLGAAPNKGQPHVPLPRWFSLEDDDGDEGRETGGIQEPPVTPIGKDELALRRHRFFSDLIHAAQHATEHRVRFDPLGPVVADSLPTNALESLVTRLEDVTTRLENVCTPVQEFLKLSATVAQTSSSLETSVTEELGSIAMSVSGYQDIIQGPLAEYLAVSQQIGGHVEAHSRLVQQAFQKQLKFIQVASESKQPGQNEINSLIAPTGESIMQIQKFREDNRGSPYFNHLSAISESIPVLGWVAVNLTPAPYVKEMNDAGQFYTNRVLKDWKEKDKKHVDWVKSWVQILTQLQAYVKQHHTTGLVWSGKGSAIPPPPPGGCPPPPPPIDFSAITLADDDGKDRSALFAEINQGEDITKSLKKVTSDMQTHKNPTLRQGPAPFKTRTGDATHVAPATHAVDKPSVFTRDGKKWLVEYQKGNHSLLVDGAEMNNVVYMFRCTDSTVTVKGKINSIILDSCKKASVVFDSLVSSVEFINCQSVQMQVLGKVPTISIDKTDGCQVYLSNESLEVEIVSSKSSEMNVLVPKANGDYAEYPIPEQYKTTVVPGKGLSTVIVESKG